MSTTVQVAYVLLALDAAAIYSITVALLALWLRRRVARSTLAPDAAAAATSAWAPGWNAPTAPHPTVAATDPWAGREPTPELPPLDVLATVPPAPAGPPAVLPRRERRRRIDRPRNDPPQAADPPLFVELVLTRR